jgi:hypothetical protein
MGKSNQFHICYVCGKKDNSSAFGDAIIEIADDTLSLPQVRRQLAEKLKVISPDISWDEATIINFRSIEDFLKKTDYLHISYFCNSPESNNPTVGDRIIRIGGDDVSLDTIYGWLSDRLHKQKPDVKWDKPAIISLQPLSEELALQLAPELKDQQ